MKDFQLPESPCPVCGALLSGAANTSNDEPPEPGDCTICIYCAAWCIFDEDFTLRLPTTEEMAEIRALDTTATTEAAVLESWRKEK